ncbi:hypothetical protein D3C75_1221860 [compost metagenome]
MRLGKVEIRLAEILHGEAGVDITLEGQQGLAGIVRGEIRLPFGKAGGVESRQFVADLHQAGDLIRGQLPGPMDQ